MQEEKITREGQLVFNFFIFSKTCICSLDFVSTVLGQDLLQIKQVVFFSLKMLNQRVKHALILLLVIKGGFLQKRTQICQIHAVFVALSSAMFPEYFLGLGVYLVYSSLQRGHDFTKNTGVPSFYVMIAVAQPL